MNLEATKRTGKDPHHSSAVSGSAEDNTGICIADYYVMNFEKQIMTPTLENTEKTRFWPKERNKRFVGWD